MSEKQYPASRVLVNNRIILDVTNTTASSREIAKGYKIVSATGAEIEGTLQTNIFTRIVKPEVLEGEQAFTSIEDAKADVIALEPNNLRNGDFLIIHQYFSSDLTVSPALSTYVYDQDNADLWLAIGSATLVDNHTICLQNGQVSLMPPSEEMVDEIEYVPFITTKGQLQWKKWTDFSTHADKIDAFFTGALDDNAIETLRNIQDLATNVTAINTSLQEAIAVNNEQNTVLSTLTANTEALTKVDEELDKELGELEQTISQELGELEQTISSTDTKINNEITRAQAAEDRLSNRINDLKPDQSTVYRMLNRTWSTENALETALTSNKYNQFEFVDPLSVTEKQPLRACQLTKAVFNMSKARQNLLIKTAPGVRLNAILCINFPEDGCQYIPTIEGDFSGIEIQGKGTVRLKNVRSIGQVSGRQKPHHLSENLRGSGGVTILPMLEYPANGKVPNNKATASDITLEICGNVYLEGAYCADGLSVQHSKVTITGDNLTAIGNHGCEFGDITVKGTPIFSHIPTNTIPIDYYPHLSLADEYYQYYPAWVPMISGCTPGSNKYIMKDKDGNEVVQETIQIPLSNGSTKEQYYYPPALTTDYKLYFYTDNNGWTGNQLKDSGGAGIGVADVAARPISYSTNNPYGQLGYGYYTSREYALANGGIGEYVYNCGQIFIKDLNFLVAEGYGRSGAGIGGGYLVNTDGSEPKIMLDGVKHLTLRGGYPERQMIQDRLNQKKEYELGWNIGPVGGPGLGFVVSNNTILLNERPEAPPISIKNTCITQCIGGNQCAGIGSGFEATVDMQLDNVVCENIIGGAGAAAIGQGRSPLREKHLYSNLLLSNIVISNSNINAFGGEFGACIGTGYNSKRTYRQQNVCIRITNSKISGVPGRYAAGIGSGYLSGVASGHIYKDCLINIQQNDDVEGMIWPSGWGAWGNTNSSNNSNQDIESGYQMPWTKAQKIGCGVQDVMEGATELVSFDMRHAASADFLWFEQNYKYYQGVREGTSIEAPLFDIPWIGELYRIDTNKYLIYGYIPPDMQGSFGYASGLSDCFTEYKFTESDKDGKKCYILDASDPKKWPTDWFDGSVTAYLRYRCDDGTVYTTKQLAKTFTFPFPETKPKDATYAAGNYTLTDIGGSSWYLDSYYDGNPYVMRSGEIIIPWGYEAEITVVGGFDAAKGDGTKCIYFLPTSEAEKLCKSNSSPSQAGFANNCIWQRNGTCNTVVLTGGGDYSTYEVFCESGGDKGYESWANAQAAHLDLFDTATIRIRYARTYDS